MVLGGVASLLMCRGTAPLFFFFQAGDGIRYWSVTGVQTCALPIFTGAGTWRVPVNPASGAVVGAMVRSACSDSAAARAGGLLSSLFSPLGARLVVAAGAAIVCSM